MGVLTIRNVDDAVIAALKARAKANHRSLEGELRYLLARSAAPRSTLGMVRERARMAAGYRVNPGVREPVADMGGEVSETGRGVRADSGEWPWMGAMSDVGEIVGDIVSPATEPSEWAALRSDIGESNDIPKP